MYFSITGDFNARSIGKYLGFLDSRQGQQPQSSIDDTFNIYFLFIYYK